MEVRNFIIDNLQIEQFRSLLHRTGLGTEYQDFIQYFRHDDWTIYEIRVARYRSPLLDYLELVLPHVTGLGRVGHP